MHYVDEGHGAPVVMVHGNPTWSFYYRDLISAVAGSGRRAIAMDHIGMGFSDHPGRDRYPFSLERRIADLSEFLSLTVGEEPIDLVVHDWGGAIGLGWAVDHVEQVRSMTIMNTAAFHPPDGQRVPVALRAARSAAAGETVVRGANAFVEGLVRVAVNRSLSVDERRGYRAPYSSWGRRLGVYEFVRDIPVDPSHPTYQTISTIEEQLDLLRDVPTLLAWGLDDFVFGRSYRDEFKRQFASAEECEVENANHLVLDDGGEMVVQRIVDFLA